MANRYWVGNTGNWNDTSHWSETDGGSGGAVVPTSTDDVYFTAASFSSGSTVTLTGTSYCHDLITTNLAQSVSITANAVPFLIYGSVSLNSKLTFNFTGYEYPYMVSSGTETIMWSGASVSTSAFVINGSGTFNVLGTFDVAPNNSFEGSISVGGSATFNTNNHLIRARHFGFYNTATINLGSSTIYISEAFYAPSAGSTVNAGTSHFILSGVDQEWGGGGKTYYDVTINGDGWTGAGGRIFGNSTFHNFSLLDPGAGSHKYMFQTGTTQTITNQFICTGTASRPIILTGYQAAPWYLDFDGVGRVSCDYLDLSYSTVTPSNTWYAGTHSTSGTTVSGWLFTDPPSFTSGVTFSEGQIRLVPANTDLGPTSATGIWAGIDPPSGGYTIYTATARPNNEPSIVVAHNDTECIWFARSFGGTNINTISEAVNFLLTGSTNTTIVSG